MTLLFNSIELTSVLLLYIISLAGDSEENWLLSLSQGPVLLLFSGQGLCPKLTRWPTEAGGGWYWQSSGRGGVAGEGVPTGLWSGETCQPIGELHGQPSAPVMLGCYWIMCYNTKPHFMHTFFIVTMSCIRTDDCMHLSQIQH